MMLDLNKVIGLGQEIETLWSKTNEDKKMFPRICLNVLENLKYLRTHQDLQEFESEISRWLLTSGELPDQLNVYNNFGQPPITLFNNNKFVIDIYFWTHYDTSIHSHSFAGAFKVLYGQSLHEVFNIEQIEKFTHDIELNAMTLKSSSVLADGDCHSINPGDSFCHRVIHLQQPTLTLCIRTLNDKDTPQWHYFENGLSIRKREMSQDIYKKLFYFQYLFEKNEVQGSLFLESFMATLEDSQVMNLFEQILTDGMGLGELTSNKVHDFVMEKYSDEVWFKHYEDFYQQNQFYIEPKDDTPVDRFLAHATNTKYTQDLVKEVMSQIKTN